MRVLNQWIVKYKKSENYDNLAILYLTENKKYYIAYTVFKIETQLIEINKVEALELINQSS